MKYGYLLPSGCIFGAEALVWEQIIYHLEGKASFKDIEISVREGFHKSLDESGAHKAITERIRNKILPALKEKNKVEWLRMLRIYRSRHLRLEGFIINEPSIEKNDLYERAKRLSPFKGAIIAFTSGDGRELEEISFDLFLHFTRTVQSKNIKLKKKTIYALVFENHELWNVFEL